MKNMKTVELCATDFILDGSDIWFAPLEIPYLIRATRDSGNINKQILIPTSYGEFGGFYEKIVKKDNRIIGIPYWAESYFNYNISFNTINVTITPTELQDDMGIGYYATGVFDNHLFSFVRFCQKHEKDNGKVFIYDVDNSSLSTKSFNSDLKGVCQYDVFTRRDVAQIDNKLFVLSGANNQVMVFDMKGEEIETVSLLDDDTRFTCIEAIDEAGTEFVLADNRNRLIFWNRMNDMVEPMPIEIDGFETANYEGRKKCGEHFSFAKKCGGKVYFFPYFSNMILELNIENKQVRSAFKDAFCINNTEDYLDKDMSCFGQFSQPHVEGDKIYTWNIWDKSFLELDTYSDSVFKTKICIELTSDERSKLFKDYVKDDLLTIEGSSVATDLKSFVAHVWKSESI